MNASVIVSEPTDMIRIGGQAQADNVASHMMEQNRVIKTPPSGRFT